jgi:hypothetical protein
MDMEDMLTAKKPKLGGMEPAGPTTAQAPSHFAHLDPAVFHHHPSAFVRPGTAINGHQGSSISSNNSISSDDHFVVERILHQRWIQNKVQYLLQLKGETSTIKVWMFDEDIFAEAEANRKQANLWTAVQSGVFPEASQLPDVEQILGAKMVGNQLMFYVKWANSVVFALVPSNIINKAAPAKVIQFYEARLTFEPATASELASPHQMISSPSSFDTLSHTLQVSSSSSSSSSDKKLPILNLPISNPAT